VKRNVPDPDETAEAMKAADDRQLHLDQIRRLFVETFDSQCPLRHFGLYCYQDAKFHAFVKLENASDIKDAQQGGLAQTMRDFVLQKLESFGRGSRDLITVDLEFDYQNKPGNPVPFDTKERLARASAMIEEQNSHLNDVTTRFNERFSHSTRLDFFAIYGSRDHRFGVVIFFSKHEDIAEANTKTSPRPNATASTRK